ncbi:MAG TPA: surface-adhesin E family protein [Caulobacteraceae bacterium]
MRAAGATLLAATMLTPWPALAADYWFLGEGSDVYDFVDISRITPLDDGALQAWTTRVLEGKKAKGKKVKTVLSLAVFYCGQDAMRLVRSVEYSANGKLVADKDVSQGPPTQITPGTVGAVEYDFVCADPFARSDKYRDLGDIEPIARADSLWKQTPGRRS